MKPRAARPSPRTQLSGANAGANQAIVIALTAGLLASCAVGPNFKSPPAPTTKSYVAGELPQNTASSDSKGGEAQRFVAGLDIPGQWWTLFQSTDLNALIERALDHNPTLEAAQAALRQANETLPPPRGSHYPNGGGPVGGPRP